MLRRKKLSPEESHQKMINGIIEHFNFYKCHETMKFLGWGWRFEGVPSVEMIKQEAIRLLKKVIDYALEDNGKRSMYMPYIISTGGLKATAWRNRYGYISDLQLEFILTDWMVNGE